MKRIMYSQPRSYRGLLLIDFYCLPFQSRWKGINPVFRATLDELRALDVQVGICLFKPLHLLRRVINHAEIVDCLKFWGALIVSGEGDGEKFKVYSAQEIFSIASQEEEANDKSEQLQENIPALFNTTINNLKKRYTYIGFLSKGDFLRMGRQVKGLHTFAGGWAKSRMRHGGIYSHKGSVYVENPEDLSWAVRNSFNLSPLTLPSFKVRPEMKIKRVLSFHC